MTRGDPVIPIKCPFCNEMVPFNIEADKPTEHACKKTHDYRGTRVSFSWRASKMTGNEQ